MLSCKDFVRESSKILDNEKLSLIQKFSFYMHMVICHHCRKYLIQMKATVSVAKNLQNEAVSDEILEQSVSRLLKNTDINQKTH